MWPDIYQQTQIVSVMSEGRSAVKLWLPRFLEVRTHTVVPLTNIFTKDWIILSGRADFINNADISARVKTSDRFYPYHLKRSQRLKCQTKNSPRRLKSRLFSLGFQLYTCMSISMFIWKFWKKYENSLPCQFFYDVLWIVGVMVKQKRARTLFTKLNCDWFFNCF